MLRVYGTLMPLRLLEEIVFWKTRESEQTAIVREMVPALESPYVRLMQDWEQTFGQTLEQARAAIKAASTASGEQPDAQWQSGVARLHRESLSQSREFVRQLGLLLEQSAAVRDTPAASTVFSRMRRESNHYREDNEYVEGIEGSETAGEPLRTEGTWSDPIGSGGWGVESRRAVPVGHHVLPPLPYPYNALEPWIDERTMRIHHDKHHQTYVDGLNKAETQLEEARTTGDYDLVKHWERELAFHGAGHYLHTIFWEAMTPRGGGRPGGALEAEIVRSFGSYEAFQRQFSEAANRVEGGGWAILVWSPRSHRLEILTAEKHQNLSQWDVVPILPLDVWEHAYYLKHQNDRPAYVKDWWNVVNWPYVAARFGKARTLQWIPY